MRDYKRNYDEKNEKIESGMHTSVKISRSKRIRCQRMRAKGEKEIDGTKLTKHIRLVLSREAAGEINGIGKVSHDGGIDQRLVIVC